MTLKFAASLLGASQAQVRRLLRSRALELAPRFGRETLIMSAGVEALLSAGTDRARTALASLPKDRRHKTPEAARSAFERGLKRFKITAEDWGRMFHAQGGTCAGCQAQFTDALVPCVDHCHATGVVRGLLCNGCNAALGLAGDSPATLRRLATYLERL